MEVKSHVSLKQCGHDNYKSRASMNVVLKDRLTYAQGPLLIANTKKPCDQFYCLTFSYKVWRRITKPTGLMVVSELSWYCLGRCVGVSCVCNCIDLFCIYVCMCAIILFVC